VRTIPRCASSSVARGSPIKWIAEAKAGRSGPAQPEFLTKKEALDKAREVAVLIKDKGVEGAGSYTTLLENGELAEFSNQLQPFGKTIADAVAHYLEVLRSNQSVETSPLVTETLKRWVAYKEAGTDGVLHPRSLGTLRYWSQRLAKIYPTQRLQHLSYQLIRQTKDELKTTEGKPAITHLRKHFVGHLSQFLNWCIVTRAHRHQPHSTHQGKVSDSRSRIS